MIILAKFSDFTQYVCVSQCRWISLVLVWIKSYNSTNWVQCFKWTKAVSLNKFIRPEKQQKKPNPPDLIITMEQVKQHGTDTWVTRCQRATDRSTSVNSVIRSAAFSTWRLITHGLYIVQSHAASFCPLDKCWDDAPRQSQPPIHRRVQGLVLHANTFIG